jgi:enamine deaminase RidA (YjgF/YER057c/UK114 family)
MPGTPVGPPGRGYANAMRARGELLAVAGQIGRDASGALVGPGLVEQFERALAKVVDLVRDAGGGPDDLISLTIYVTDLVEYQRDVRRVGDAYRRVMGKHFPAMALVQVVGLVEPGAKVEIQGLAVLS